MKPANNAAGKKWGIGLGVMVVALAGYFLLGGDNNGSGNRANGTDSGTGAATSQDSTIRIGLRRNIQSFDPQNNGSFGTPLMNVFDTLVRLDRNGNFQPQLAKTFQQRDPLTWAFTLHENVRFHNGDELTADDVKFTLERVASDTSLIEQPRFASIEKVNVLGKHHFEIITNVPDPVLPNRLIRMGGSILPARYFREKGLENFLQNPIGSGPYKVVSYQPDRSLVLQRFDDYFKGRVSDWEHAFIVTLPNEASRVNELVTGGMDWVSDIPPAEWKRINNQDGLAIADGNSTLVMLLIANSNKPFPTSDVRVRQAIDYAIDSRLIVDRLFNGMGTPTRTHITPGILGFEQSLYDQSRFDPERARALLLDAGYGENNPLKLHFQIPQGRYLLDSELGQLIAAMLQNVGIQVQMELMENSKYISTLNSNKNRDLMLTGYGNSMFDPFLPLNALNSKVYFERIGYKNRRVDDLLDTAIKTMNPQARADMYKEAQQILAIELPYIYLYQERYFTGINSKRIRFDPPPSKDILLEDIKKK